MSSSTPLQNPWTVDGVADDGKVLVAVRRKGDQAVGIIDAADVDLAAHEILGTSEFDKEAVVTAIRAAQAG